MTRYLWLSAWLALGCSAQQPPPLSAVEAAVASDVAKVQDWAEQNAANVAEAAAILAESKAAAEKRDYLAAAGLVVRASDLAEKAGAKMPDAVREARMVLGMLAAQAVQDGLRALSNGGSK